jgi:hypothetical protein
MSLKDTIENFLNKKDLDNVNAYGISTRIEKAYDFLENDVKINSCGSPYDLLVLEMLTPTLNVKALTAFLMDAKANLAEDGLLVFDFIEETHPMLTVGKKMESWRGKEEEEVYCYTLIDIASALTALGLKISGLDKVGSLGNKQIVAVFVQKIKVS